MPNNNHKIFIMTVISNIVVSYKACDENVVPLLIYVNLILIPHENHIGNVDLY